MEPNRSERRALASRARRGIPEPEPETAWRLRSGRLVRFYGRIFPGVPIHRLFVINFAFGAATGCVLQGVVIAAIYFLSVK